MSGLHCLAYTFKEKRTHCWSTRFFFSIPRDTIDMVHAPGLELIKDLPVGYTCTQPRQDNKGSSGNLAD